MNVTPSRSWPNDDNHMCPRAAVWVSSATSDERDPAKFSGHSLHVAEDVQKHLESLRAAGVRSFVYSMVLRNIPANPPLIIPPNLYASAESNEPPLLLAHAFIPCQFLGHRAIIFLVSFPVTYIHHLILRPSGPVRTDFVYLSTPESARN